MSPKGIWDDYSLTIDIDLNTLIRDLDKVASDIVSHQRDVLAQRKDLAQKTKEFHKLDNDSKVAEYRRMFKGTQFSSNY